ncbi:hypothetical protein EVA_18196 [gut metagenome]|uniref:Uncharacterized protein n=1 Tax=gut metagenome TaxID=749906 RepID=J9FFL1_9ZZZZ
MISFSEYANSFQIPIEMLNCVAPSPGYFCILFISNNTSVNFYRKIKS